MYRNEFKNALIIASLALSSTQVVFAATPAAPDDQTRAVYLAHQEELNKIAANRQGVIQDIVDFWAAKLSPDNLTQWEEEVTDALSRASNERLLKIQKAGSYSEVLAILQGHQQLLSGSADNKQSLSVSADNNLTAPAALGDTTSDLVYSPVPPCRIFDTRESGGAYGDATRDYHVYGNAATMAAQGGYVAPNNDPEKGCPAPQGEPSGISINFTAVPVDPGWAFATLYPYGTVKPFVGFITYNTGIISNAGIIQTSYLNPTTFDLSVYHSAARAHSIGDVMGYFYPARPAADFASGSPGVLNPDGLIHNFNYSVEITTTTDNQKVFWTAHQPVGTVSLPGAGAGGLNIWPCWRVSVNDPWIPVGAGAFGITMTGTQRNIVSESAVVAPGAGTHYFSLCYRTSDPNWNFNDFGYVAAQRNP